MIRHGDINLVIVVMAAVVMAASLFLYCLFGILASENFERMADCLYESNWFEFPIKSQKYIWIMIFNTQIPLFYHGFGIAVLNLETFCDVKLIEKIVLVLY